MDLATQKESACLTPVDFDSRAFGFPFYRVTNFDKARLASEIAALDAGPLAVDAKLPSHDVAGTHALMRMGFRKVCMQIILRHNLAGVAASVDADVRIADRLPLDDDTIWALARNFTQDRFSLDPLLPAEGGHRLFYQWLRNSLSGAKQVAHIGPNICTFSRKESDVVIDLVSILEQRRGYGARIIRALVEHARSTGANSVLVTTECENTPAWSLYQRCGFAPDHYTAAFHLVRS